MTGGPTVSDITVRKVRFEFPDDLGDVFPGIDPGAEAFQAGFSLTLPHLEPYLIRVYRRALPLITDEALAADVDAFIGQEAQHHRNHRRANEAITAQLDPAAAASIEAIEQELEDDYRRYAERESLRFNLAYAEGFEAMTCAFALTGFEQASASRDGERSGPPAPFGPWQQLWAWHGAEEIEHRTVAFDVYHHLCGSYPYRVFGSLRAQVHFLRYIERFKRVLMPAVGTAYRPQLPRAMVDGPRRYLRTFLPTYDPADIDPGPLVGIVLAATRTTD